MNKLVFAISGFIGLASPLLSSKKPQEIDAQDKKVLLEQLRDASRVIPCEHTLMEWGYPRIVHLIEMLTELNRESSTRSLNRSSETGRALITKSPEGIYCCRCSKCTELKNRPEFAESPSMKLCPSVHSVYQYALNFMNEGLAGPSLYLKFKKSTNKRLQDQLSEAISEKDQLLSAIEKYGKYLLEEVNKSKSNLGLSRHCESDCDPKDPFLATYKEMIAEWQAQIKSVEQKFEQIELQSRDLEYKNILLEQKIQQINQQNDELRSKVKELEETHIKAYRELKRVGSEKK